jgi:hypothetical protein
MLAIAAKAAICLSHRFATLSVREFEGSRRMKGIYYQTCCDGVLKGLKSSFFPLR